MFGEIFINFTYFFVDFLLQRAYIDFEFKVKEKTMKKLIVFVVVSLLSVANVSANDCYRKALNDFSSDSAAYQFYDEDISADFEDNGEKAAVAAIRLLENQLGCEKEAFRVESVACKEIVPGNSLSKACYAESNLGFFFVSVDMMERVNLVFNRFD